MQRPQSRICFSARRRNNGHQSHTSIRFRRGRTPTLSSSKWTTVQRKYWIPRHQSQDHAENIRQDDDYHNRHQSQVEESPDESSLNAAPKDPGSRVPCVIALRRSGEQGERGIPMERLQFQCIMKLLQRTGCMQFELLQRAATCPGLMHLQQR